MKSMGSRLRFGASILGTLILIVAFNNCSVGGSLEPNSNMVAGITPSPSTSEVLSKISTYDSNGALLRYQVHERTASGFAITLFDQDDRVTMKNESFNANGLITSQTTTIYRTDGSTTITKYLNTYNNGKIVSQMQETDGVIVSMTTYNWDKQQIKIETFSAGSGLLDSTRTTTYKYFLPNDSRPVVGGIMSFSVADNAGTVTQSGSSQIAESGGGNYTSVETVSIPSTSQVKKLTTTGIVTNMKCLNNTAPVINILSHKTENFDNGSSIPSSTSGYTIEYNSSNSQVSHVLTQARGTKTCLTRYDPSGCIAAERTCSENGITERMVYQYAAQ